ncbi:hypothetical protein OG21DRAFT_1512912 [Imleria badia]|nr:hypothetical protein OG21DRAFT_1512912 [Imleria badia]
MDTLPPELVLYLIPFFPLTSLIAVRSVNTRWRSLAQIASLHPARKALLDVYLAAIIHPNFQSLVEALQPHAREFDREVYVADLTSRGCVLPDLFELWVLEWPSNAIHFWAWPGLAKDFSVDHKYYYGWGNMLGETTLTIDTIPVPKKEAASVGKTTCQALALWEVKLWGGVGEAQLWLVVDANERINDSRAGRLLWTHTYYHGSDDGTPGGTEQPKHIFYDTPLVDDSFIEFLDLLDYSCDCLEYTGWLLLGRYSRR